MRALVVFFRLAPFVLAFVWDRRRFLIVGRPRQPDEARHRRRAERLTRTLAELNMEEKNAISHRGKAFRKAAEFLHRQMR